MDREAHHIGVPVVRDLGIRVHIRRQIRDIADRDAAQDDGLAILDELIALDCERVGRSRQQQEEQQRREADQSASARMVITANASLSVAPSLR